MRFKRVVGMVMSAVLAVVLCGCGSETPSSDNSPDSAVSESVPESDTVKMSSAKELTAQMKVGWCLGNTLDSTGGEGVGAETSWGNLLTTKEMIDSVKNAGFNVLRVPVSWGTHMDENYVVDEAWMDRVQEVVDYGYGNGMFVILNTHHEEWYMPKTEELGEDTKQLTRLWEQISERFKDYGERLIFEGLNEPRLRGESAEWTGTAAAREIINEYAETFVRTVRASGGNNAERTLMITPYAASSMRENLAALKIPENAGNIIVSVHAYLPYSFALDTKGTDVYDPNNGEIPGLFKNIKEIFIDKDIPVVIGEFGCVNKTNTEDRVRCVTDYLSAAKELGVPCLWWDNGSFFGDGENFGMLMRRNLDWFDKDVLDAIMSTVNG
ncbi:MAG: glycoside hydrolase family 5 protein [Lachnospiraceae bacterium]|nr:glycoside hydrolase family 5 protein [Ruminococcus sp.]MCM1274686.1 glycoside hydrolase family 5 protein [Lachnospiraceae bacterium]